MNTIVAPTNPIHFSGRLFYDKDTSAIQLATKPIADSIENEGFEFTRKDQYLSYHYVREVGDMGTFGVTIGNKKYRMITRGMHLDMFETLKNVDSFTLEDLQSGEKLNIKRRKPSSDEAFIWYTDKNGKKQKAKTKTLNTDLLFTQLAKPLIEKSFRRRA